MAYNAVNGSATQSPVIAATRVKRRFVHPETAESLLGRRRALQSFDRRWLIVGRR